MLYYTENVIDVSALCEDKQMQRDMEIYAKIRNTVLDECYSIKGYSELPYTEKQVFMIQYAQNTLTKTEISLTIQYGNKPIYYGLDWKFQAYTYTLIHNMTNSRRKNL